MTKIKIYFNRITGEEYPAQPIDMRDVDFHFIYTKKEKKEEKMTKKKIKKLERRKRNKLDKEWKEKVKQEFNNQCIICSKNEIIHCHHIIPRENKLFRHQVLNGVTLCPLHHKYSFEISAHKNSLAFLLFYQTNFKERYEKLRELYLNINNLKTKII